MRTSFGMWKTRESQMRCKTVLDVINWVNGLSDNLAVAISVFFFIALNFPQRYQLRFDINCHAINCNSAQAAFQKRIRW